MVKGRARENTKFDPYVRAHGLDMPVMKGQNREVQRNKVENGHRYSE